MRKKRLAQGAAVLAVAGGLAALPAVTPVDHARMEFAGAMRVYPDGRTEVIEAGSSPLAPESAEAYTNCDTGLNHIHWGFPTKWKHQYVRHQGGPGVNHTHVIGVWSSATPSPFWRYEHEIYQRCPYHQH